MSLEYESNKHILKEYKINELEWNLQSNDRKLQVIENINNHCKHWSINKKPLLQVVIDKNSNHKIEDWYDEGKYGKEYGKYYMPWNCKFPNQIGMTLEEN